MKIKNAHLQKKGVTNYKGLFLFRFLVICKNKRLAILTMSGIIFKARFIFNKENILI